MPSRPPPLIDNDVPPPLIPDPDSYTPAMEEAAARHLAVFKQRHAAFLAARAPLKASLWLALMRPGADVVADAAASMQGIEPSDDPTEDQGDRRPAIVMLGEMIVAKALRGDMQAAAMIADRIEGKPGVRPGDEDVEASTRREEIGDAIMETIDRLTKLKHAAPAIDVPHTVIEDERVPRATSDLDVTETVERLYNGVESVNGKANGHGGH